MEFRHLHILVVCTLLLVVACSESREQESLWEKVESGTTLDLYDIWGTSRNDVWVVGDVGTILHYDGHLWSSQESGTDLCLRAVYGFAEDDVWVVGGISRNSSNDEVPAKDERGVILHFDGEMWSDVTTNDVGPLLAIWGASPNEIYAGGQTSGEEYQGRLISYNGVEWEQLNIANPFFNSCRDLWGSKEGELWVVTGDQVLHFTNSKWDFESGSFFGQTTTVWGSSNDNVYVGHCLGEISHGDGNSVENMLQLDWGEDTGALNFYGIWGSGPSDIFAVGGYWENVRDATIYHFDGSTWTEHGVRNMGDLLYGVWGASPTDVWAVGEGGMLLEYQP